MLSSLPIKNLFVWSYIFLYLFTTYFNWIFGKIFFFENCQREFHFCWHEIDYTTFASAFFVDVKSFELERLILWLYTHISMFKCVLVSLLEIKSFVSLRNESLLFWVRIYFKGVSSSPKFWEGVAYKGGSDISRTLWGEPRSKGLKSISQGEVGTLEDTNYWKSDIFLVKVQSTLCWWNPRRLRILFLISIHQVTEIVCS